MPINAVKGLLGGVGNVFMGAHAFGDPQDAYEHYAPAGLIDTFDDETRERLGRRIQGNLRRPGSRSRAIDRFQGNVMDMANRHQSTAANEQWGAFVDQHPGLNENQRLLLRQLGPEAGAELLTESETLSPGQANVNPFLGSENFAQPTKPIQDFEYGQRVPEYGEERDRRLRSEQTTTVAPGHQIRGPDGELVDTAPTTRMQNEAAGVAEEDPSTTALRTRRGKIEDYMRLHPEATEQKATDWVDSNYEIATHPETGRFALVNKRSGAEAPTINPDEREYTLPSPEELSSTRDYPDLAATTGVAGWGRRVVNQIADIAGGGTPAPMTDEARTALNRWNQQAKLIIAEHVTDSRRSNMLLEMLDSLTADPASIFQGTENARRRMEDIKGMLDDIMIGPRSVIERQKTLPPGMVQENWLTGQRLLALRQSLDGFLEAYGQGGQIEFDDDLEDRLRKYE